MNDQAVRAKNAIIPVAYYLFQNDSHGLPRYKQINKLAFHKEDRLLISKWLNMALLKSVFGAQSDSGLQKMRDVIAKHHNEEFFPLKSVIEAFKNTSRDLRFSEEYIEGLLRIEHGDPRCRSVLALLYPEMNENLIFDIDHLHPSSAFKKNELQKHEFLDDNPEKKKFYSDRNNWNSILNLHLLNVSQNRSKKDKSLSDWVANSKFSRSDILLDNDVSLEFQDFKSFIDKRKAALMQRMLDHVFISSESDQSQIDTQDYEQVSTA